MVKCPTCEIEIDVSRNLAGKKPVEGDTNICCKCGAFLTYLNDGSIRAYGSEELRILQQYDPMTFAFLENRRNRMLSDISNNVRKS